MLETLEKPCLSGDATPFRPDGAGTAALYEKERKILLKTA
jgi:hypothetical protein